MEYSQTGGIMAKNREYKPYKGEPPIPKPEKPVQPNIVTAQDGIPKKYHGCDGVGVRVVHPTNPKSRLPCQTLSFLVQSRDWPC